MRFSNLSKSSLGEYWHLGKTHWLPQLPTIAGDEGFGEVLSIGSFVTKVKPGQRVVLKKRMRGTWRLYGLFDESDLQVVSFFLSNEEAATLSIAPRMAYRMLLDFRKLKSMESIIQTGADSPCGQMVIQLCKIWDIDSINILSTNQGPESDKMKKYLYSLGANIVIAPDEAKNLVFNTSVSKPVLGLNSLGGRHQDIILKEMVKFGTVVNYGKNFNIPFDQMQCKRPDLIYQKFNIIDYDNAATTLEQDTMYKFLAYMMIIKKLRPPLIKTLEMKDYIKAMKSNDDFITIYMFDFSTADAGD